MLVDEVSIPYLIFLRHRGLRVRHWDGSTVVYACSPNGGVVRQTLEKFANGHRVTAKAAKTRLTAEQVVARAKSMLGRQYDGIALNCDHFVEYALGNKVESAQLRVAVIAGMALVLGALARS
jgi:hypothetical protein